MNNTAFFKLSYGLFMISAKSGDKLNGCIMNTVTQITDNPKQVSIALNKSGFTHDMIMNTKEAVVTVLSTSAPFETFKHFGFQSGREVNKFENISYEVTPSGLPYLAEHSCAYLVCKITQTVDMGSHTLFLAEVTDAEITNPSETPLTYAYYHENVKPKPQDTEKKVTGWRCKICGYIYEGEELPADFICPICKHGASDFEKI